MKKLFSLLIIMGSLGMAAQTNQVYTMKTPAGIATYTLIGTGTDSLIQQVQTNYESIAVQVIGAKVSGTVTSVQNLYGSLDGVNYIGISTPTVTFTDQTTNSGMFIVDANPFEYYMISGTGTATTQQNKITGKLMGNGIGGSNKVYTMKSTTYTSLTLDTVTNTGSNSVTLQVQNWYKTVTIQPVITKISGTVGGTVTLQGSNNGSNYVTIDSHFIKSPVPFTYGTAVTYTPTDVTTNTTAFVIKGSPYAYYRVSYTGTGTMSASLKAYLLPQR